MKHAKLLPLLAAIALLTIGDGADAAPGALRAYSLTGTALTYTLDASSGSFTAQNGNANDGLYGLMVTWLQLTDSDDSTTAISATCYGSPDGGTTWYTLQEIASGSSTDSSVSKDPHTITSPKKWPWRYDVEGFPDVKCTYTDTGGVVADTLQVKLSFSTKGS